MFLGKGVLKINRKFTEEHPCWSLTSSVISIKLQSNFIETTLRHGCSPVNSLNFLTFLWEHLWRAVFDTFLFGRKNAYKPNTNFVFSKFIISLTFEFLSCIINPFHVTVLLLYCLKTSESQWFLLLLGGIERVQWNEIG